MRYVFVELNSGEVSVNFNLFVDAAKVASLNMLQEDFGGPTTKLLSVLSCLKYIENPTPTPWAEDPPPDPRETSKEEVMLCSRCP